MQISVNIGIGDFIDRYTILSIKKDNGLIVDELDEYLKKSKELDQEYFNYFKNLLFEINLKLWNLESCKRSDINNINISKLITHFNDIRSFTKKEIDTFYNSNIKEIKSYENINNWKS